MNVENNIVYKNYKICVYVIAIGVGFGSVYRFSNYKKSTLSKTLLELYF